MNSTTSFDELLNSSESAKIFFASLPDYVRGAVVKNSVNISSEDELHRFADSVMHEFN
ncbi:MAG: hypothetical protein IJF18_00695 [Oscillospiraceae bacterium]|nr:hypothetical protein [Oscillospiraceae bacterium]